MLSPPPPATVYRTCVVNAVRESEALMARLVQATVAALTAQEQDVHSSTVAQRDAAGAAQRLLDAHANGMVKAYPMALLEIFAEGPDRTRSGQTGTVHLRHGTGGTDLGELSLVDDADVQAQVALSRAQQHALHATDAILAELDALMGAAQGLRHIQPERNPLRPYNYLRALQQVVADTGVPLPVREDWMQALCRPLGAELAGVYQQAVQALRTAGIAPVGYGRAGGNAAPDAPQSRLASGHHAEPWLSAQAARSRLQGFVASDSHSDWEAQQSEEALLTVELLHQMLVEGSDFSAAPAMPGPRALAGSARGHYSSHAGHSGRTHRPDLHWAAQEAAALQDRAALEQLVLRLSQDATLHGRFSGESSRFVSTHGASGPSSRAAEIVARMVETMAEEGQLLVPVQRAVQRLEPAVRQLVRHDLQFFSDSQHPARRLLDEITQRSLAFEGLQSPGFSRFMGLVDEAVGYLSSLNDIADAQPFDAVLAALQSAWESQAQTQTQTQVQKQHSDSRNALLQAMAVPPTPSAQLKAAAQSPAKRPPFAEPEPPNVPGEAPAAVHALPMEQPQPLAGSLPDGAGASGTANIAPTETASALAAGDPAPDAGPPAAQEPGWVPGAWFEMHSAGRTLRTQLTWTSPQQTLFLFTAADGSTQSMTRRVRDKLVSTGALQRVPAPLLAPQDAAGPAPHGTAASRSRPGRR